VPDRRSESWDVRRWHQASAGQEVLAVVVGPSVLERGNRLNISNASPPAIPVQLVWCAMAKVPIVKMFPSTKWRLEGRDRPSCIRSRLQ
jgi:hypothetical protein